MREPQVVRDPRRAEDVLVRDRHAGQRRRPRRRAAAHRPPRPRASARSALMLMKALSAACAARCAPASARELDARDRAGSAAPRPAATAVCKCIQRSFDHPRHQVQTGLHLRRIALIELVLIGLGDHVGAQPLALPGSGCAMGSTWLVSARSSSPTSPMMRERLARRRGISSR